MWYFCTFCSIILNLFYLWVKVVSMVTNTVSVFAFKKIMIFHIETKERQKQFIRNSNFISLFFCLFLSLLNLCDIALVKRFFLEEFSCNRNADWNFCRIMEVSRSFSFLKRKMDLGRFIYLTTSLLVTLKYFLNPVGVIAGSGLQYS